MKKLLLNMVLVTGLSLQGLAQEQLYTIAGIPDTLMKGANAVKRFENILFEVTDVDRAKYYVHKVVTVLNKEARNELSFVEYTNKYRSVDDVEIQLYDGSGKTISRYRKKDMQKQARGEGLIEEGMYNYIPVSTVSYPVTMEIKYQINYSGTLFYPSYYLLEEGMSVQQSQFTVKVPKELGIRFKPQKTDLQPVVSQQGNYSLYQWATRNLYVLPYEDGSGGRAAFYPRIQLAPNKFRIYSTNGDMSSWNEFGKWGYTLLKDREVLPEERKQFFANLVKDASSDKEKIQKVYNYLQENFRYVSIQLGIGGYQPFPAKFTDEKKYGDCKGLSFYTHSVLASLGIKSYVALINSGYDDEPADPSFPANKFNHMILCVPQAKDTVWLECTSKTNDFGFLGSNTENRNALLLTERGGVLVATPKSDPASNRFFLTTHVFLQEDGSGKTNTSIKSAGEFTDFVNALVGSKREDQKDYIVNYLGFKQPDEFLVAMKEDGNGEHAVIDLQIEKIPQFSAGSKMFLSPRMYSLYSRKLPSSEQRTQDYYFNFSFQKSDTTVYHIPSGFSMEVLPKDLVKNCPFASYSAKYWVDKEKNEIHSVASLELRENKIPANKYAEVKKFFDELLSDNTQKIVIKKN